jgi:uncharacterized protein YebE (UPF0316 family)
MEDNRGKLFTCYDPKFLAWTVAAAIVTVVLSFAGNRFAPLSLPRLLIAGGEALAIGGVIVAMVVRLGKLDELQRHIQYESIAYAFGVGLAVITGWEFLEKAGLPHVDWGVWAWPAMTVIWGLALSIVSRRYR